MCQPLKVELVGLTVLCPIQKRKKWFSLRFLPLPLLRKSLRRKVRRFFFCTGCFSE